MTPAARLGTTLAVLGGVLLAVGVVALVAGTAGVPPAAVLRALTGGSPPDSVERVVTLELRLPRAMVASLAGGALAVAGVGFQGLTRNPLAEPSILGVSSGAAFGVVVAQVLGLGISVLEALAVTAFAFGGAVAAAAVVYAIGRTAAGLSVPTLLLAGVIVGIFFSSAITVVISLVDFNRLGGVVHWLLGNIGPVPPASLAVFAALAATGFWLIAGQARELNLLALGEEGARHLGVDAERLKRRVFLGAALLTGTVVAFAGPIGFVGLIVPHALRGVLGPDHRLLVPAALVGGAAFLLGADTLARTVVAPAELSVGVLTAFGGAPFFVYLLRRRERLPG